MVMKLARSRQWREWTGLPIDRTADVIVPEALKFPYTATRNTTMLSTSSPTSG